MTDPAPVRPFDARPLTDPADPRAVTEFWRRIRSAHPAPVGTVIVAVIVGVVAAGIAIPMIGVAVFSVVALRDAGPTGVVFSAPLLILLAAVAIGIPLAIRAHRRARVAAYRLARFAAANGMTYQHRMHAPPLPGMIFQHGSSRIASSLVRGHSPRFVEFGNYQYTTGSGKNRTTHHWGYVAVRLDVPLPNIVLDAVGNNTLGTNLPASFSRDQRLSLEGDFDRYFTLYCPGGYEADALYLFTPDIMARFIDHAAELDVEIVDDWMFLYMRRRASTTDAATWQWLFGVVGALIAKLDQWARWRDERLRGTHLSSVSTQPAAAAAPPVPGTPAPHVAASAGSLPFAAPAGMLSPPPGVAPPGRRLKKSFSWVTVVVIIIALGFAFVPQLFGVLAALLLR